MMIDYQKRLLTIGRTLPEGKADFRLPMRVHRLAMVRGMLNSNHPTYFVVDTGGEVISISADTASALPTVAVPPDSAARVGHVGVGPGRVPACPASNLDFDRIEYRNFPLVVLNLRAPSLLLGFQLGGIVGHKFLALSRLDGSRAERAAPREVLNAGGEQDSVVCKQRAARPATGPLTIS